MKRVEDILIYGHGGSGNRGCEAIIKTILAQMRTNGINNPITLSTLGIEDDLKAELEVSRFVPDKIVRSRSLLSYYAKLLDIISGSPGKVTGIMYRNLLKELNTTQFSLYISVGGDNYSTNNPEWLYILNKKIDKVRGKRILLGCSIEPSAIDEDMISDLKGFSLITARETITYNALIEKGLNRDILKLIPDPAFLLESTIKYDDMDFIENAVGINISPLVISHENTRDIVIYNYLKLIEYILSATQYNIVFIPHVIIPGNNDYKTMELLFRNFSGNKRVRFIKEYYTASETKSIISRCKMFVGARTHSTIAAYSSCVPTVVVGYSVKSRGIALDLFGENNNLVIPISEFENKESLLERFLYLSENQSSLKKHLKSIMNKYCKDAQRTGQEIKEIINRSENS